MTYGINNDSVDKGAIGEAYVKSEIKKTNLFSQNKRLLRNVYIPKPNGQTTELDLVWITQKGIFVIECKNLSGIIVGKEHEPKWSVLLSNKRRYIIENPITQNLMHIKWLISFLGKDYLCHSVIVFSKRSTVASELMKSSSSLIAKRDMLCQAIDSRFGHLIDSIDNRTAENIYLRLRPLSEVNNDVKHAHIAGIKRTSSSLVTRRESKPIDAQNRLFCPHCGRPLVLRTAKKGISKGKQFYGCAGYPECKYIKKLD